MLSPPLGLRLDRGGRSQVSFGDVVPSTPDQVFLLQDKERRRTADSAGLGAALRHRGEKAVEPSAAHWATARDHDAASRRRPSTTSLAETISGPGKATATSIHGPERVAPQGEHGRGQSAPPLAGGFGGRSMEDLSG